MTRQLLTVEDGQEAQSEKRRPRYMQRASDEGYIDLARHRDIYSTLSGDREQFVGFERRYDQWAQENPRSMYGNF